MILSNLILILISSSANDRINNNESEFISDLDDKKITKQIIIVINSISRIHDVENFMQIKNLIKIKKSNYFLLLNGKILNKNTYLTDMENLSTIYVIIRGNGGSKEDMDTEQYEEKDSNQDGIKFTTYLKDEEFNECKKVTTANLGTRINMYGETELIPRYRAPKFFIDNEGIKGIFPSKQLSDLKGLVQGCIDVRKAIYYKEYGVSFAFKSEEELFTAYHQVLDKPIEENREFTFGAGR